MSPSRVVILLLGLVSIQAADSSVLGPEECFSPLAQWCGDHACPDYQESVADLERLDPTAICHRAQRGRCGDLRFTTRANPTSGITHYFGTDGKVLGVTTFSDVQRPAPCDGGWRHYGGPLRCSMVTEHEYCRNPRTSLDPRGEITGRIIDATTGRPLQGAVVVAAWYTELLPNPAEVLFGLVVGAGHGSTEQRIARVQEVFSGDDGRFLMPAWTEAEQLRGGRIRAALPALIAFFPGYEPVSWWESEPEVFGAMSAPRNKVLRMRPSKTDSLEKVRTFSNWLDMHVWHADDPDAPADSRLRVAVRTVQQRAAAMARQELIRLRAKPSAEK